MNVGVPTYNGMQKKTYAYKSNYNFVNTKNNIALLLPQKNDMKFFWCLPLNLKHAYLWLIRMLVILYHIHRIIAITKTSF